MLGKFIPPILFVSFFFFGSVGSICSAQQEEVEGDTEPATSQADTSTSTNEDTTNTEQSGTDKKQPKSIERPKLAPVEQGFTLSLKDKLPADEVLMLPKADSEQLFLAAYLTENTGSPKGGILLIPAEGQHVNWPKAILPLRKKLPDAGWHTLAIMPIYFSSQTVPKRTFFPKGIITLATKELVESTSSEQEKDTAQSDTPAESQETESGSDDSAKAEDQTDDQTTDANKNKATEEKKEESKDNQDENKDTAEGEQDKQEVNTASQDDENAGEEEKEDLPPYDPIEDMLNRINQGLAHLAKQGLLYQVFIAQGEGAHWALTYLTEKQPENVHALVLINPTKSKLLTTNVTQLLEKTTLLTLDIYTTQYPAPSPEASARVAAAHRNKNYNYFQYRLPAVPGSIETTNEWLFKRIKSWLKRRTKTTEVTTKKVGGG